MVAHTHLNTDLRMCGVVTGAVHPSTWRRRNAVDAAMHRNAVDLLGGRDRMERYAI